MMMYDDDEDFCWRLTKKKKQEITEIKAMRKAYYRCINIKLQYEMHWQRGKAKKRKGKFRQDIDYPYV